MIMHIYAKVCILKLDIQGYFMRIKHQVIYQKVLKILDKHKTYNDLPRSQAPLGNAYLQGNKTPKLKLGS